VFHPQRPATEQIYFCWTPIRQPTTPFTAFGLFALDKQKKIKKGNTHE
jgi:hypothetical protein